MTRALPVTVGRRTTRLFLGFVWACLSVACSLPGSPTAPDSAGGGLGSPRACEIVFNYGTSSLNPDTRVRVVNNSGYGLRVDFTPDRSYGGTGAEMAVGECDDWGFGGDAVNLGVTVAFQRCSQQSGSTSCIGSVGSRISRRLTPTPGSIVTLDVNAGVFPTEGYSVPGIIPTIVQPTNHTCWAAAYTILASWKANMTLPIGTALSQVGPAWRSKFDADQGISPAEKSQFLRDAGLKAEPATNLTLAGWTSLLRSYGPLWVTTENAFGLHARILVGISGDGSDSKTLLSFVDPGTGTTGSEPFVTFVSNYEAVVRRFLGLPTNAPVLPQVVHW